MTPNLYDEGPYECVLCGGQFKTEERAKEHHRIDHGIKNSQQLNAAVTERLGPYVIKPIVEEEDTVEVSDVVLGPVSDTSGLIDVKNPQPTDAPRPCNNCTKHERGCTSPLKDSVGLTSCVDQYPTRSVE